MKYVEKIKKLPVDDKYVIVSDMHMGIGDNADDFAHNQHIVFYLLNKCLVENTKVILLGDVFEAAENKNIEGIKNAHDDVMWVLGELDKKGLLTYIRGNHDAYVKEEDIRTRTHQYDGSTVPFIESEIFDAAEIGNYLCVHGHQTEWVYNHWTNHIINWLLRVGWHGLQNLMCRDPSTDQQGWQDASKTDKELNEIGIKENKIIIAGHTHKCKKLSNYYNIGSFAVLPRTVTYGVLDNGEMSLRKCRQAVGKDKKVFILDEVINIK